MSTFIIICQKYIKYLVYKQIKFTFPTESYSKALKLISNITKLGNCQTQSSNNEILFENP